MVLLLNYPGVEFLDVIYFPDVAKSIANEVSVYPRLVRFPQCENWRSAARCAQVSPTAITMVWGDNETNLKNSIDLGSLLLEWDRQEDVLTTAPSKVVWNGEDGTIVYPIPTLVRGVIV